MSAPRVEKIGGEISENVDEVGRRCRRGRTAEWKDARSFQEHFPRRDRVKDKEKKVVYL